jgi:hypothetical protein
VKIHCQKAWQTWTICCRCRGIVDAIQMTCECLTAYIKLRYCSIFILFEPGALQGFASDVAHLVSRRTEVFLLKTLHVFCVPSLNLHMYTQSGVW